MSSLPNLSYREIVHALQRDGWVVARQRGRHIRLHQRAGDRVLRVAVPAHRPVKQLTLAYILKQAELTADRFLELL